MKSEDLPLILKKYSDHNGNERAYIRDIILGIDDGLISTTLLTVGVYASGLDSRSIILSILSGSLGGSISMGLGEFLATKSQLEVTQAELELEKLHIKYHLKDELKQVHDFLQHTLLIQDKDLIQSFVKNMGTNSEGLFNFMKTVEFGVNEEDSRNPIVAMSVSGGLFFIGSMPSIISFLLPFSRDVCFLICCLFNVLSLFAVGTLKTRITKTNFFFSGLENMGIGMLGGVISFFVGYLFAQVIES